jgi:hypothetical protein
MRAGVQWLAYNPNDVKAGWIAFFVVMALLVATFFLWRNMNKQLKRIRVPHRADVYQPGGQATAERAAEPGAARPATEPGATERTAAAGADTGAQPASEDGDDSVASTSEG